MSSNGIGVEQCHHRPTERPKDELKADDQAHPFVNAAEQQWRQSDAHQRFTFFLRFGNDQMSNHAPLKAIANALQVAMRSNGLLTSERVW